MNSKNILIISPEPWDGHSVSKHHYAITLANNGVKVYFLDPPKSDLKDIVVKETEFKNLYCVQSPKVAKGLQYMPKFVRNFLEAKWLNRLETIINNNIDTIWLFENSRFYNMEFAGDRLKIYHQVDLNQNFHIKEASKSADICFCTTDYILKEIQKYNKKVFKIHHGVALNSNLIDLTEEQKNFFKKNKINVAYIGNLGIKYLDYEILEKLVKNHPNILFHFIGGYEEEQSLRQRCKKYKNIIWWGKVKSNLIPSILSKVDILLVAYKIFDEFSKKQLASPHKIMEYLLSGKVIVSTYLEEYKNKRDLIEMVDNPEDFIIKFDEVINNLDYFNSKDKQNIRIKFAKENTYIKKIKLIDKLVKQYTNKELL